MWGGGGGVVGGENYRIENSTVLTLLLGVCISFRIDIIVDSRYLEVQGTL